jgi:hypothetical protein
MEITDKQRAQVLREFAKELYEEYGSVMTTIDFVVDWARWKADNLNPTYTDGSIAKISVGENRYQSQLAMSSGEYWVTADGDTICHKNDAKVVAVYYEAP